MDPEQVDLKASMEKEDQALKHLVEVDMILTNLWLKLEIKCNREKSNSSMKQDKPDLRSPSYSSRP
jgi:hypothetical protein